MVTTGHPVDGSEMTEVIDLIDDTKKCRNLPSYPLKVKYATGKLVNGYPVICGGYDGYGYSKDHYVKDCHILKNKAWSKLTSLQEEKFGAGSITIGDSLWVTGGKNGQPLKIRKTSEFVFLNGTTKKGPTLPQPRDGHCMLQLDEKRVMLIGSGWYHDKQTTVNYNFGNNTFTKGPRLNQKRKEAGCVVFKSPMHDGRPVALVVGGFNSKSTSEILDFTKPGNKWVPCKQTFLELRQCKNDSMD